jgi:phenylalanyl-tRNA synthetase alpha chain
MINISEIKNILEKISTQIEFEEYRAKILGSNGLLNQEMQILKNLSKEQKGQKGKELNELKKQIEQLFSESENKLNYSNNNNEHFDYTKPGIQPKTGNLHLVTQAINEITEIFAKIGFTRVRHPEIDSDHYSFEALNMPKDHPARDEWETFFIDSRFRGNDSEVKDKVVLTPHTSNGQVREMEKRELPIRMINIAKCYRRQSDISHVPMFHQFEGLYVDKNVSIKHLIGVIDYFGKQFFGEDTKSRIRPFHFQFTEPSFEVDYTCSSCHGKGCRLCKGGWLELGGAGMVHPNVLKAGGINPDEYSGFAFGIGIERTWMVKTGIVGDARTIYTTDIRLLKQF